MAFFSTDTERETLVLTNKLGALGSRAIPTVVAQTLDKVAFIARTEANKEFEKEHIIRSTWTQRGMLFENVKRGGTIATMESRAGNIRPYAEILEKGGTVRPRKTNLMSPALAARGGDKRKRIRPSARLSRLTPRRMPAIPGNPRRRFAAMLNLGRKENYFGPFMITSADVFGEQLPQGIFNLAGAGRKRRGGGKIRMIRKMHKSVEIRGHGYVRISARRATRQLQELYNKNARRTLNKVR